jgi:hypothetical protein
MWMKNQDPIVVLRKLLMLDAATCAAMGVLLLAGASFLARLMGIPAGVLFYAGLALLPIAAFMAIVARRAAISAAGVWSIVAGNVLWVAGSLWLAFGGWADPNTLGLAFILLQAAAVAALAVFEYLALQRASAGVAAAAFGK